mmetsp:Transcript_99903/g.158088  ORF Transcript_99903/g.158088 Transcript_99903/m.158088 type:complete len:334 (-) Transcript_99903:58-1059(-)
MTAIRNSSGSYSIVGASPQETNLAFERFPDCRFSVSLSQCIGDRKTQEDRYLMVPTLDPAHAKDLGYNISLFGVFDGTVGDFASDNVTELVLKSLLSSSSFAEFQRDRSRQDFQTNVTNMMREMYHSADHELLGLCSRHEQHYATCTSVTLLVLGDYLVASHLGDSRIAVGRITRGGAEEGAFLTTDHKPDNERERERIEASGGMVERLVNHNNKPFIRGGDFMMRKALGEQPMQLQYSRAFGAKDLKCFGLIATPDVQILSLRNVTLAILASDGLWDVFSAQEAVDIARQAIASNANPTKHLVTRALEVLYEKRARADNITVMVLQFDDQNV